MTCRQVIDFLADYLDGDLPPAELARFESHLHICPYCRDYLASYRATIRAGRHAYAADDEDAYVAKLPIVLLNAVLATVK